MRITEYLRNHFLFFITVNRRPIDADINSLLNGSNESFTNRNVIHRDHDVQTTPTTKQQVMDTIPLCLPYLHRLHLHNCSCRELAYAIFKVKTIPDIILSNIRHLEFHNLRDNCVDFACQIMSNTTQLNEIVMRYTKIYTTEAFDRILNTISNHECSQRYTLDQLNPDNLNNSYNVSQSTEDKIMISNSVLHSSQNTMFHIETLCLSSYWIDDALVKSLCKTLASWHSLRYLKLIDNGFGILCIDGIKQIIESLIQSKTKSQLYGLHLEHNLFQENDETYLAKLINTNRFFK